MGAVPRFQYAVAPLHNVSLPKSRDLLTVGQYRVVRVKPRAYDEEYVPGRVLRAMHDHEELAAWANVLNEGYKNLAQSTPRYVAYFFAEPGEFGEWMRRGDFADVEDTFAAFHCALSLMRSSYVSLRGNLTRGVSMKVGAIVEIFEGRQGFDKTPDVPMMFNPKYLDEDEPEHRLTKRDVGPLSQLVAQVRMAQKTRLRTAVERLVSSVERSEVDQLIDLLVALEVLYGDDDRTALAHKIAFRCSTIVEASVVGRERTFAFIKQAYNRRSRILHGETADLKWLHENLASVDKIVRLALKWAVEFCWKEGSAPEGKDVDRLSFKATPAQL